MLCCLALPLIEFKSVLYLEVSSILHTVYNISSYLVASLPQAVFAGTHQVPHAAVSTTCPACSTTAVSPAVHVKLLFMIPL